MSSRRWSRPYVGDKLAPSIRAVAERSGIYVIRDRETHEVLYVGESHSKALAKTIARHFQRWKGPTAGARYDRDDVEVAVRVFGKSEDAVRWQDRLIRELAPRDNVTGQLTWWERLAGGGPPRSALADALTEDVPF